MAVTIKFMRIEEGEITFKDTDSPEQARNLLKAELASRVAPLTRSTDICLEVTVKPRKKGGNPMAPYIEDAKNEAEIGVDVHRYGTVHLAYDYEDEIPQLVRALLQSNSPRIVWEEPELESTEIVRKYGYGEDVDHSEIYGDMIFQERREAFGN